MTLDGIMLSAVIHNIIAFDLNTVGLILGFLGALILTIFGLPPVSLLNEGSYGEITITPKMKRNMRLSRLGLLLVCVGFAMQLISAPSAH